MAITLSSRVGPCRLLHDGRRQCHAMRRVSSYGDHSLLVACSAMDLMIVRMSRM